MMLDLFSSVYYFAIFSIPIVLHIVFIKKRKSPYNNKAWYGFVKQFLARSHIKRLQNKCRTKLSKFTLDELESPRKFVQPEKDNDTTLIYGADENGNSIIIRMILRQQHYAELSIQLKLKNGKIYQLPNEPKVLLCSTDSNKWKAGDLTITILEPFSTLRLVFNGLMRNVAREEIDEETGEVEHIKFNFIWKSGSDPLHYPQDYNWKLLAENLAGERWRDGDWIKLLGDSQHYDQYGSLHGLIKGTSFPAEEYLYFKSLRKRDWGKADCFALKRHLSIFVTVDDGNIFNVGVKSIKNGCAHAKYGSVLFNNRQYGSIEDTDLNLEYIGDNKSIPDCYTFHVTALGRSLKCVLHFDKSSITKTYNDETIGWKVIRAQAECIVNGRKGRALATLWHPYSGYSTKLPKPILSQETINFIRAPNVINFKSAGSKMLCYTGGKGCSLGSLATIETDQFIVPEGFVVTTESFRHQLRQKPHLFKIIQRLEKVASGRIAEDLKETCEYAMKLIGDEEIDEFIAEQVYNEIKNIQSNSTTNDFANWKWAVRSSGVCEDSDELSAAGQNSTFLGIPSGEKILRAIASCWASLYSFQSVQYRRQYGLKIDNDIAVVVQKMIPSEAAGVLFTCHPTTEDPSKMVITGNFGLGESVVSGKVDPDTIVLRKTWNGDVSIETKQMGQKENSIYIKDNAEDIDGTQTINVDSEKKNNYCITEEQAIQLGKVGVLLEELFGNPRDIEWAFYKGDLYLLQSRPVTTLNVWTEYELLHEFDTAIFTEETMTIRANVGEVMPKPISALTYCVVVQNLEETICSFVMGMKATPFYLQFMNMFNYCVHMEAINGIYRFLDKKIELANKLSDILIYGHVAINEKIHKIVMDRHGATKPLLKLRLLYQNLVLAWSVKRITQECPEFTKELSAKLEEAMTLKPKKTLTDCFEKIMDTMHLAKTIASCHHRSSVAISLSEIFAMVVLAENNEELTPAHYSDVAELLSSCQDVVSANVPNELEKMSQMILASELEDEFVNTPPKNAIQWLEQNCPNVKKCFDNFIKVHGHRGLIEFELTEQSWSMCPEIVVEMLQKLCKSPTQTKKIITSTLDETLAQLKTTKKRFTKPILKFLVTRGRRAVGYREHTKSEMVRAGDYYRKAFIKLGKEMVFEGFLPQSELIFHLTLREIEQILTKRDPGLVLKATLRHRFYSKWKTARFPEISFGVPKPIETESMKLEIDEKNFKMNGVPASAGEVVGRACVIKTLDEINELQTGDILITHATDIGWSPYFPMLSGVVTELGGLISHGAVVAREYGLPCIIGVTDVCNYFVTGDRVLLSAKTGTLQLLSRD